MNTVIPSLRISIIASLLLCLALAGPGLALAQDKHIDLSVVQNKLVFNNSECPGRPNEMGCVEAPRGSSPNISWELDGESNRDWALDGLQFSPNGSNWGDSQHPLADCTMEDFSLSPGDRTSGNASTARVVANGQKMMIKDNNHNECLTYYMVHARNRNSGEKISAHPVIDNRGGN
jgi:hypothetical protein